VTLLDVVVLNGPNLNRLATRDPAVYGSERLDEVVNRLQSQAKTLGLRVLHQQSNHEGELVDYLHGNLATAGGVICNPAGLTSYGASLRDALVDASLPLVIVHISNYMARPAPWARNDIYASIATACVIGLGVDGYSIALDFLAKQMDVPVP
jgi:3-dehydroquinate dehydratase-2